MTKAEKLRTILMAICATSLVVCTVVLIVTQVSLSRSRTELRAAQQRLTTAKAKEAEAIEGLSYACGYLAGQTAMIRIADLRVAIPPAVDGCDERKAVATRNGFDRP